VSPHSGRSALDAVELMNIGVNFMREHVQEDARLHYVIINGGGQPNVVPPEATVWYYIRADKHQDVEMYYSRVQDIARGAALMTQTDLSIQVDSDMHEIIPNDPLTDAIDANLRAVGTTPFTPEEHAFAARLQAPLIEQFQQTFPTTLNEDVKSADMAPTKGSTDVGDISWKVPTGGLRTTCFAAGSPGHSWQNVACIGSSIGEKGVLLAAKVLSSTAVQLLQDAPLRATAKADLDRRMQGREYTTLVPKGQKAPQSIR
jgi:aminobenzoyl-glutamate utilization protein B